jgi:uncharacterized PurR-regulated membrane protein YhhQ (DUF165 family)
MGGLRETIAAAAVFAAFAATIPAANWMIGNVGTTCALNGPCLIPVGFGLMAPSGVLMIGVALVLRDQLHEVAGWRWSFVAVILGGVLSLAVATTELAVASAVSFTASETLDLAVYARLRAKGRALAVMGSQVAGAVIDSAIFVLIAFGSLDLAAGNTLGKLYAGAFVAAYFAHRARQVSA